MEVLAGLGVQVPALALVIVLVVFFLRHQAAEAEARRKIDRERLLMDQERAREYTEATQELTREVHASRMLLEALAREVTGKK